MMYRINDRKMFYDMADGQAVVINFETGMYYGMSSLGSAVLDSLLNGAGAAGIAAAVMARPGCPEDIEGRIDGFIRQLTEKEILVVSGENASADAAPAAFGEEAFADGFALEVNEYAEAQDLILADPIHDVDVNMGWPIMKGN